MTTIKAILLGLFIGAFIGSSILIGAAPSVTEAQGPAEIISARTINSKTFDNGDGTYALDVVLGPIHYKDDHGDPDEPWKDIDTEIVPSPKPQWDWEVVKGNWHLLIREDTAIAVGKGGNWLGFRYTAFGYLDWASKDYAILQARQAVTPVVDANTITWPGIFMGTDLEYIYTHGRFKENLYVSQATRDWLAANPPSSYGLDNQTSYLVGIIECDWQLQTFTPKAADGTAINWNNANEFIDSGVFWHHPVTDKIITALPLGEAWQVDDPSTWVDLRYRFYQHTDGTHYLLTGGKVTDLNALAPGTIVLDPSIDEEVGASTDDCQAWYVGNPYNAWSFGTHDSKVWAGRYSSTSGQGGGGMRFTGVSLDQGTTIENGTHITFHARVTDSGNTVRSRIEGEDVDDAATFSSYSDYSGRSRTTASVNWDSIGSWTENSEYDTPEIKTVIQEIVNRGGWSSGNDMVLFWDDHDDRTTGSSAHREAESYNGDSSEAPALHIEYASGCSPSIEVDQSTWNVNSGDPVATDTSYNTGITWATITNNSGGSVDITIGGTDATGGTSWDLTNDATNGNMIFGMKAGLDDADDTYDVVIREDAPYNQLVNSLADSGTQDFGLWILTPTVHTDGVTKSSTVTLTAVCE
jgi:hypothetical protein